MKRWIRSAACVLAAASILPAPLAAAQAKMIYPTYPGDTEQTMARRMQWIEGAKKEGRLVWWNTVSPVSLGNQVIAAFNSLYPFIQVEQWLQRGEEIAAKLDAEFAAGRRSADIALGGEPYNYPRWRNMGMLEKFIDIVPGLEGLDKRMYGRFGDWAQPGGSVITPQINTRLVTAAQAPKKWEDLLDPQWKGHLSLTTDMKVWTSLALADGGWGVEKTEDFLRRIREQQLIWSNSHSSGLNLLIAGEFKILGENYLFQVLKGQQKGAPVDWVPVNPVAITGPSFTLQKRAPHPNAARLFLEWILSPGGLKRWEDITWYGSPFPGMDTRQARLVEHLSLAVRTEAVVLKTAELDLNRRFSRLLGLE